MMVETDVRTSSTGEVEINETDRLIASGKVEGTPVFDRAGARMGAVYNMMIDKVTGKVAYAVMSFGGFLGIGERYHALPWEKLDYDTRLGGYVVDVDRSKLEAAPSFAVGEDPWADRGYGRGVRGYWDVAPLY